MSQRMVHSVSTRISLGLLPLLAATAFAQDTLEEEVPEVRRYTVEMIIFAYEQNVATGSEIFVPDEPPPIDPLLAGEPVDGEMMEALSSVPDVVKPERKVAFADDERKYELVMLPEDDFTLLDAFERLDNLDAYTPLLHFGWTQPTYPKEDTATRPLESFVSPPPGLAGDLRLYLSRYLHLAVNLQLDAPVDETKTADEFSGRYFSSLGDDSSVDGMVVSYPVRYRIEEDRIFRNGELRYFDHPKFGVLAKISRVEEEEPTEEELLGDAEFLGFDGE